MRAGRPGWHPRHRRRAVIGWRDAPCRGPLNSHGTCRLTAASQESIFQGLERACNGSGLVNRREMGEVTSESGMSRGVVEGWTDDTSGRAFLRGLLLGWRSRKGRDDSTRLDSTRRECKVRGERSEARADEDALPGHRGQCFPLAAAETGTMGPRSVALSDSGRDVRCVPVVPRMESMHRIRASRLKKLAGAHRTESWRQADRRAGWGRIQVRSGRV
jgi:hypothetical protein